MKSLLLKILVNSPLQWAFLWRNRNQLKVLCYHEIHHPSQFVQQLEWLQGRYSIITPQQLEDHCYEGKALPARPLLITFDDGDISLYEQGLPVLKKYKIPTTLFIITSLIDTDQAYWWEEIRYYAPAHLQAEEKEALIWKFKELENEARLAEIAQLKKDSEKAALRTPQLTSDQLEEMEAVGMVVSNHTHTHPLLDCCSPEEVIADLQKADAFFQEKGYAGRHYFAYPNGNYSGKIEEQLKRFGFRLAFLFDHQLNQAKINPLRISRLSVNSDTSINQLKLILSDAHSFLLGLKKLFS